MVIDSGASEHVVRDMNLPSEVEIVLEILVEIANGTPVGSTHREVIEMKLGRINWCNARHIIYPITSRC